MSEFGAPRNTLFYQASNGGKELSSTPTARLIITTPFGGTETDKVKAQFDKIKQNTDTKISSIDSTLEEQKNRVNNLRGGLDTFITEATKKINDLGVVATANITSQEGILSSELNIVTYTIQDINVIKI